MAGTKLIGSKDRCGVLPDKLADVNVVDVKRSGLIIAGCVSQTQLKKASEITELLG